MGYANTQPRNGETFLQDNHGRRSKDANGARHRSSCIPHILQNYREKLSHLPVKKAETQLRTYTREVITPKGQVAVQVEENNHTHTLPLLVVDGSGPPLLGHNWLAKLKVPWNGGKTNALCTQPQETEKRLNDLQIKYPNVFKDVLGTLKGIKAKVNLKEGAIPVFC